MIAKMHPLIIPPFTNKTLSRAVVDYLNVKIMYRMFDDATSFNQPLNNWDVSNVTYMDQMFEEATSFNQPLHAPWYAVEQSDSE